MLKCIHSLTYHVSLHDPGHITKLLGVLCRDKLIYDIGTIKLADFGLSKSLPINKHVAFDLDDTYKLTGETGSYRYMVTSLRPM